MDVAKQYKMQYLLVCKEVLSFPSDVAEGAKKHCKVQFVLIISFAMFGRTILAKAVKRSKLRCLLVCKELKAFRLDFAEVAKTL